MSDNLKVVHYINQFYGGFGGEDTAGMGIVVKEVAVGPGQALQANLKGRGEIVATVICGDNYVTENIETAVPEIASIIKKYSPDLFVAGPGFNAGRYGLACGAITAAVTEQLHIPAVTGLYKENPGTELYQDRCYILESGDHGKYLRKAMQSMAAFGLRLVDKDRIGSAKDEGYHGSGPAPVIDYETQVAVRAVNMLLAKYKHEPFETEVRMPEQEYIELPVMKKPLKEAKIAIVTDGRLVPAGNPDSMPAVNSKTYKEYDLTGKNALNPADYEVSHQGYNNAFVNEDPNRLVPVDAMRELVHDGKIASMFDAYFTTAGVRTSLENAKKFGKSIAEELLSKGVDAVLLVSTLGTSTRCGAAMTRELERAGLPTVHITNLIKISEGIGPKRIMKGNSVVHVLGNPEISHESEVKYRKRLVSQALDMLMINPDEGTQYILDNAS